MKTCKIVDCTLRDGGYYTDWDFSEKTIEEYIDAINALPIDTVELGYRSNSASSGVYLGQYYYMSELLLAKFRTRIPQKKIAVMLNAKEVTVEDVPFLLAPIVPYVDIVRVAIDPDKVLDAIEVLKKIKEYGVSIALNCMYASILEKRNTVLNVLPEISNFVDVLNIVDSYGGLMPDVLEAFLLKLKKNTTCKIGFHAHNNLELAFSNTLTAIKAGVDFVDSTFLGIGRGAGNLKTELIIPYLYNTTDHKEVRLMSVLLETLHELQKKYNWGVNLAYIYTGLFSFPQKDVMDLITKNRYTLSSIVSSMNVGSNQSSSREFNAKETPFSLLVGGGRSVEQHVVAIEKFLKKEPDMKVIFTSSRYCHLFESCRNSKYLVLSGDEIIRTLHPVSESIEKVIVSKALNTDLRNVSFSNKIFEISQGIHTNIDDSPLNIALELCSKEKNTKVYLCGFDGFDTIQNEKELMVSQETQAVISTYKSAELISITKTVYHDITQDSVYAYIG